MGSAAELQRAGPDDRPKMAGSWFQGRESRNSPAALRAELRRAEETRRVVLEATYAGQPGTLAPSHRLPSARTVGA